MTDKVSIEAARFALNLLRTDDQNENEQALYSALLSFDEPLDRLSVHFHATRLLAHHLREQARVTGRLDHFLTEVDRSLFDLLTEADDAQ